MDVEIPLREVCPLKHEVMDTSGVLQQLLAFEWGEVMFGLEVEQKCHHQSGDVHVCVSCVF